MTAAVSATGGPHPRDVLIVGPFGIYRLGEPAWSGGACCWRSRSSRPSARDGKAAPGQHLLFLNDLEFNRGTSARAASAWKSDRPHETATGFVLGRRDRAHHRSDRSPATCWTNRRKSTFPAGITYVDEKVKQAIEAIEKELEDRLAD
jgi:hypothetical protein